MSDSGDPPRLTIPQLRALISERLAQVSTEARQLDRLHVTFNEFVRQTTRGAAVETPVELVHDCDHLIEVVTRMAGRQGPLPILAVVHAGRTIRETFDKLATPWEAALRATTIRLRAIVRADAMTPGPPGVIRAAVTQLAIAGAQVRLRDTVPGSFAVLGEDAVVLPTGWGLPLPERRHAFALARAPVIAAALRDQFELLWAESSPPQHVLTPEHARRTVLRLAAEGMADEAIARRLGVSVRTVRARFAEAMSELGARSRFQAGVAATRSGWLSADDELLR